MKKRICLFIIAGIILTAAGCTGDRPLSESSASSGPSSSSAMPTGSEISTEPESSHELTVKAELESYTFTSEYLADPVRLLPLVAQTASFWLNALDSTYGGFFTYVANDGSINPAKQDKTAFSQSRDAYAMAKAYQLTGDKKYLDAARNALDFAYAHAWDAKAGGWIQEMTRRGNAVPRAMEDMDWNSMKWSFNQLNMFSGISAMVELTRSSTDEAWLDKAYNTLADKMWDSRPGYEGYYDMTGVNWNNPQGKNIGTVNDLILSHQMTLTLLNNDAKYRERLLMTADRLVKMVQTMDSRKFGMNEYYDLDWKAVDNPETTYSGNLLQPAWCLAMAYTVEPKPEYKEASKRLVDQILNSNAYDYRSGGSFSTVDAATGNPKGRSKSWWSLQQCVDSGIFCYYITGNAKYLKMADETMNFYMDYMYDKKYGDSVGNINDDGSEKLDNQKGDYWKDAYNTMQFFYYTYVYGNLMLHGKPVSLYYMIEKQDRNRSLAFQPVSLGKGGLLIKSITLDGRNYTQFDSATCIVEIPANTGGEFKVTFEPAK